MKHRYQWGKAAAVCLGLLMAWPVLAQGTQLAFAGLKTDVSQPVEVSADQLAVNQADGTAVFSGNVVVVQGTMKLQAGAVTITYSADQKSVQNLHAEGGVILAAGQDAATAATADYQPESGDLILAGSVILTQGPASISGEKLTISLKSGTGTMSGRVTTVFSPGKN